MDINSVIFRVWVGDNCWAGTSSQPIDQAFLVLADLAGFIIHHFAFASSATGPVHHMHHVRFVDQESHHELSTYVYVPPEYR